jgi:hypothetical protein
MRAARFQRREGKAPHHRDGDDVVTEAEHGQEAEDHIIRETGREIGG